MELRPRISIVIGVQKGQENLGAILSALEHYPGDDAELLICFAKDDPVGDSLSSRFPLRPIEGRTGAPIPELWRDGILAAQGDRIAFLTAHCIPDDTWLTIASTLDMDACVAYGGPIANSRDNDAADTAMHLLRYSRVTPPQTRHDLHDIAADNAVYRRADILECEDLLPLGFWEPSYHARFRQKNLSMKMEPDLLCTHRNRYSRSEFMLQRREHGRAFGLERARRAGSLKRWLLLLFSPATFIVFGLKLSVNILKNPVLRRDYARSAPWLLVFLANWTIGESLGYADGVLELYRRPPK